MTKPIIEEMHIDCSRATAFDLMADVRKITLWNGSVSRAEMTSDEPIGEGSRFITVNRGQQLESTITTFNRPERLEFDVTGKAMDVAGAFIFTEANGATTLEISLSPRPKGVMAVLIPLLRPLIRRDLAKQHAKFKDLCESQAQSAGP
jgi:uncharacterized protein YndB with AHSA1/START domain